MALSGIMDAWHTGGGKTVDIDALEATIGQPAPRAIRGWAYWVMPLVFSGFWGARMATGSGMWFDYAGVATGVLLLALQLQNRYAGGSPTMFRDAMLRAARCPACAYSLQEIVADPADGCTVCPECGSVWRIGTPASPTSATPPAIAVAPPTDPR